MRSQFVRIVLCVAALVMSACGGHGGHGQSTTTASITIVAGNGQSGVVGTELPTSEDPSRVIVGDEDYYKTATQRVTAATADDRGTLLRFGGDGRAGVNALAPAQGATAELVHVQNWTEVAEGSRSGGKFRSQPVHARPNARPARAGRAPPAMAVLEMPAGHRQLGHLVHQ